ncbi:hypothetical protein [Candidatus Berkiella aquae]|uniref:Glycosyltransferase RgtA/B/C/D-like domain-containing protein n=1 Tax=Candidatus Berkiella aquae TaxID=295108 RepID=A0A0Q9YRK1_9GAMM|nr:hypothetical protein [Candidatus Berkiella aquae]MCS5712310.1 hypothetical protein [Candidatus Berkiella aquae]
MRLILKQGTIPLILLVLLLFSPYHALMKDKLYADDASYLAHGFTLGLDYNLQYKDSVAEWKTQNQQAAAHPIGPGLFASPFIAAFSLLDKISNHPVIKNHTHFQYSWSFFGFAFSSVVFFVLGLYCYIKGLEDLSFKLSRKHFLFVASSFGILFYVLFRPVMGHSFEFFTIALCFWSTIKMFLTISAHEKLPYRYAFICALSIILTMQIRPANINVILLPVVMFGFLYVTQKKEMTASDLKNCLLTSMFGAVSVLICYLPFLYINEQLYGMLYPSSSAMYGPTTNPVPEITSFSDFINTLLVLLSRMPHILTICFSSEFGLAFSSAILFFGTVFLYYYLFANLKQKSVLALSTLIFLSLYIALPVVITLFWQSLGDAYGYRFLYCLFPLAILGYGFWHQQLKSYLAKVLQVTILLLCGYGLLGNMLFGLNNDLLYKSDVANSFGREGGGAVGYNFAVLESAAKPSTWVNLTATRTPGFFMMGILQMLSINPQALDLPQALAERRDKFFSQHTQPPVQTYLQALIICLFFVGSYIMLIKNDPLRK